LTASINEPFTVQMSDEQLKRKYEQQKAKAPPPGRSRLLSRANRQERNENHQMLQRKQSQQQKQLSNSPKIVEKIEEDKTKITNGIKPQEELKQNTDVQLKTPLQSQSQQKQQSPVSEPKDADDWQNLVEEIFAGKRIV
jgi:hypothetical protein